MNRVIPILTVLSPQVRCGARTSPQVSRLCPSELGDRRSEVRILSARPVGSGHGVDGSGWEPVAARGDGRERRHVRVAQETLQELVDLVVAGVALVKAIETRHQDLRRSAAGGDGQHVRHRQRGGEDAGLLVETEGVRMDAQPEVQNLLLGEEPSDRFWQVGGRRSERLGEAEVG